MKLFNDNSDNKNRGEQEMPVDRAAVVLSARQVSWVVSGFLLLSFFIFMAGYFLGQRKVFADFTGKVEQESLGDMIFASLYTKDSADGSDEEGGAEVAAAVDEVAAADTIDTPEAPNESLLISNALLDEESASHYYAELIGFGTERAAQIFVERLQKDGILVEIKKRTSKTARGKLVAWYQVVTHEFNESAPLLDLVKKLEKKEHLKGVTIQTCS